MILVTGAAGRLGRRVVRLLLERGHEVVGTDRVPCEDAPSPFVQADLCDAEIAAGLLEGAEALIHLGAIPGPTRPDPTRSFRNNVSSTFNILFAAGEQKLRRVVFSSSAFAVGWSEDPHAFVPHYLPLDEEHPLMPFEPYGLSKQVGECIGAMLARRGDTSVVSLRFTNVVPPEQQAAFPLPAPTPDTPLSPLVWAFADPRDVAEAHVLALEGDTDGHEAFLLAQPTTRFLEPTAELIERNFSKRIPIRGHLDANASVINTEKARRLLGFKARYGWGL